MNYYHLMYDYAHGDDLMFLTFDESELPFGRYDTDKVIVLPTDAVYCKIAEDQTEECDYIANDLTWLVISERVKEIFDNFNVCKCQYIKVFEKESNKMIGYLVNCLERHDALDVENSAGFQMPTGFSVTHYAIKEEIVQDMDMFRLAAKFSPWFISERLRKELKKIKAKGFSFSKIWTT